MEFSGDANCSQLNVNRSCFEFSEMGFHVVVGFRTGLSALAALLSLVAIICSRVLKNKTFVDRLIIYLCVAAFFNGIVTAIQLAPIKLECGFVVAKNLDFCRACAGLIQYSVWTILILMSWISAHIILVTVFNKNFDKDKLHPNKKNLKHILYETSIVVSTLLIPIVCCTIPIHNYGLAGAWCWIRTTDKQCHEIRSGVAEQFVLWYVPIMVFVLFYIIGPIIVLIYLKLKRKSVWDKLKKMGPLVVYPIIFIFVYSLGFANRVYYAATNRTVLGLWISHGIADTLLPLIIPTAFLVYQCNCQACTKPAATDAANHEPQSNDERCHLITDEGYSTFQQPSVVNAETSET